jgi:hypothetical protein
MLSLHDRYFLVLPVPMRAGKLMGAGANFLVSLPSTVPAQDSRY